MGGRAPRARRARALLIAPVAFLVLLASDAQAVAPSPGWSVLALAAPTNFKPGDEGGLSRYETFFTNNGAVATDRSPITITDTLPKGLGVKSVELQTSRQSFTNFGPSACNTKTFGEVSTVTCTVEEGALPGAQEPALLYPGEDLRLAIQLVVPLTASGPIVNRVHVEGGGAEAASGEIRNEATEEQASAGFEELHATLDGPDGKASTGAASHPYQYTLGFAVNLNPAPPDSKALFAPAKGALRQVELALPPGLIDDPTATPRCTAQQFNTVHGKTSPSGVNYTANECPNGSAVGSVNALQVEGVGAARVGVPLYNLVPPKGMPAQFGFQPALGLPFYFNTKLRSEGDFGTTLYLSNVNVIKATTAASVTLWGTPADPSHDRLRGECAQAGGICPAESEAAAFLRLPSSCADPLMTTMRIDTWAHPGAFVALAFGEAAPNACELPDFSPQVEAKPTTNVADAPSGLHLDLHLPQAHNEDPEGVGEADLRDATVTLPPGLPVNPASADGLAGCSAAQIGLITPPGQSAARFSAEAPNCPDASKLGTVEVRTPLVDHPLPGAVYLAMPHENPFGSLLATYLTVDDPRSGVVVKLAVKLEPDPLTGQLTAKVSGSPQIPFEDLGLDLFEGPRALLRTPSICGTHTTTASLTPWSSPASGPDAKPFSSFQISQAAGGGACRALANAPRFEAGTAAPVAGAYSPFLLRLARQDGSQEIKGFEVDLPPGLLGKLAGFSYCPETSLAVAASTKSGRAEQTSPSCPASSQLGTVTVAAGAGPTPLYAQGKAYLAGPYKGAPFSMAIVTPALAGPFDLGTAVVRAALQVDPETARIHAVSDPIPTILEGIPLDVRSVALRLDRDEFTINPTSCDPLTLDGRAISVFNQPAPLSQRFQVGGCRDLDFKPRLSLKLGGSAGRGQHPALRATLTMPGGGANIASAQIVLPFSQLLDQAQVKAVCSSAQFAAGRCPKRAIYGHVVARTPLLDQPLRGPVYLRRSSRRLPDLVADLNGQVHLVLRGRIDSRHGRLEASFESLPDAPLSKLVLSLSGAKRGLLVNSRDVCAKPYRASASFTAQSGKRRELSPALRAKCKGQGKRRSHR